MIVEESDDEDASHAKPSNDARNGGAAFVTAMTSTDGAIRDARGNLKFNKNTKRGREAEQEANDAMDLDELIGEKPKNKKKVKKEVVGLGEEFRSKVGTRALFGVGLHRVMVIGD
jgi:ribosomal RNA-processing protein 12